MRMQEPRADLGGITNTRRLRRAVVATGALVAITTGPILTGSPSTASAQPQPAPDPTSTTAQFAAITADFELDPPGQHYGPPAPAIPARTGMGDNPSLTKRTESAASRSGPRTVRAAVKPVSKPAAKPAQRKERTTTVARKTRAKVVKHRAAKPGAGRHRAAPAARHKVIKKTVVHKKRTVAHKASTRKVARTTKARGGMSKIISFARSKVGMRYVRGGTGGSGFDCSGLVKRAYRQIGISLPHSSGGIRARTKAISRSAARPGDIVVGPGHVGIYMGGGKMIDAGNSRVGVSYRKMYRGLYVARLR
jgi:cell wall-associated NlpC family hydrolase